MDAHTDCQAGISSIIELKQPSYLIRGERTPASSDTRYIVTSAFDKSEFKIWKLINKGQFNRPEFQFHIKITTSLPGIKALLQSAPDQIVCVDNQKTLKFYNFIDKVEQKKTEAFQVAQTEFQESIVPFFNLQKKNRDGEVDILKLGELLDFLVTDYQSRNENADPNFDRESYKEAMYDEMDLDGSGFITVHELKVFLTKKFVQLNEDSAMGRTE